VESPLLLRRYRRDIGVQPALLFTKLYTYRIFNDEKTVRYDLPRRAYEDFTKLSASYEAVEMTT
jgi:hypothetical protein